MRGAMRLGVVLWLAVACEGEGEEGTEATGTACGSDLTCEDGTFCLATIPAGGTTGDEDYSCEPLPEACDSFDHMCFDDPPCLEDWAAEVCPGSISFGCVSFGGADEAYCNF